MKLLIDKMKGPWEYIWNLKFFRDLVILQWGSFWDLGLSFLASIIYARLLGVHTYGDYALIFAFTGLVRLFMDWGTGYATLTLLAAAYAKQDRAEIKDILTYYFKLNFIVFGTIGLSAFITAPYLTLWLYHSSVIGELARLIIVSMFFQMFFSLLTTLLQVMRKMKYLIIAENIFKSAYIIVPIILVLLGYGLAGIVWGYMLAIFCSMFFALIVYRQFARRNGLVPRLLEIMLNFSQVKISRYFKFGFLVAMDNNIANSFGILPLVILGHFAASGEVAGLKIAVAYLALPNIFITPIARLLQVQLPKANVAGVKDLKHNFYRSSLYAGFIFFFLVLAALAVAPFLILTFYGQQFALSIKLVYLLSLGVMFSGFTVGFGSLYRTINKNVTAILINLGGLVSGGILFAAIFRFLPPIYNVVCLIVYWSLFSEIAHLIYLRGYLKKLGTT